VRYHSEDFSGCHGPIRQCTKTWGDHAWSSFWSSAHVGGTRNRWGHVAILSLNLSSSIPLEQSKLRSLQPSPVPIPQYLYHRFCFTFAYHHVCTESSSLYNIHSASCMLWFFFLNLTLPCLAFCCALFLLVLVLLTALCFVFFFLDYITPVVVMRHADHD